MQAGLGGEQKAEGEEEGACWQKEDGISRLNVKPWPGLELGGPFALQPMAGGVAGLNPRLVTLVTDLPKTKNTGILTTSVSQAPHYF